MDDLNYLLHREQVALLRAQLAASSESRCAHEGLARAYGVRIRDHRAPYRTPLMDGTATFSLNPVLSGHPC
jgi:hypothetical protein